MNKIVQIITEPSIVRTGSDFKLKIKAVRYITYGELKKEKVVKVKQYKIKELKGEYYAKDRV